MQIEVDTNQHLLTVRVQSTCYICSFGYHYSKIYGNLNIFYNSAFLKYRFTLHDYPNWSLYMKIGSYTERNVRLNLDLTDKNFHTETNTGSWWRIWCRFVITTDKKFHTERNTGSWWRIWSRFVITNRYSSQCEIFYPLGSNSTGNFSQCIYNCPIERLEPLVIMLPKLRCPWNPPFQPTINFQPDAQLW